MCSAQKAAAKKAKDARTPVVTVTADNICEMFDLTKLITKKHLEKSKNTFRKASIPTILEESIPTKYEGPIHACSTYNFPPFHLYSSNLILFTAGPQSGNLFKQAMFPTKKFYNRC